MTGPGELVRIEINEQEDHHELLLYRFLFSLLLFNLKESDLSARISCALLNSKIKGASKTSQHCNGEAVDIKAIIVFTDNSKKELPYTSLYEDIKAWTRAGRMTVDQCIQEKSGNAVWVHVSLKSQLKDCRKQFLKYNGLTYKLDVWYR